MVSKMEARTARQKAAKKDKKLKKQIEATVVSESVEQQPTVATTTTSDDTADILPSKSSSKAPTSQNVKPFVKREAPTDALIDPDIKRLKDGVFSVAEDKSKSEVYKSLFTSHKSEQDQSRAHWVTYNPFYN